MTENGPMLMKVSSGLACIAFASEALGRHCIAALGVKAPDLTFVTAVEVVSTWPEEKTKSTHAILFRREADIARYVIDRVKFPYTDFLVPAAEL